MKGYEKLVPSNLRRFLAIRIENARDVMEKKGHLTPIAFVGHFNNNGIMIPGLSTMSSDAATQLIRKTARQIDADFSLYISEGWLVPTDSQEEPGRLRFQYDELDKLPNRLDVVLFRLETHAGQFFGWAKRELRGDKYTFGKVEMHLTPQAEVQLVRLLPPHRKVH